LATCTAASPTRRSRGSHAGAEYAAATGEFERWFKERVHAITGVDPNEDPLGPPTPCIFDSRAGLGAAASAESGLATSGSS
jgi:hypothetical protein